MCNQWLTISVINAYFTLDILAIRMQSVSKWSLDGVELVSGCRASKRVRRSGIDY